MVVSSFYDVCGRVDVYVMVCEHAMHVVNGRVCQKTESISQTWDVHGYLCLISIRSSYVDG